MIWLVIWVLVCILLVTKALMELPKVTIKSKYYDRDVIEAFSRANQGLGGSFGEVTITGGTSSGSYRISTTEQEHYREQAELQRRRHMEDRDRLREMDGLRRVWDLPDSFFTQEFKLKKQIKNNIIGGEIL